MFWSGECSIRCTAVKDYKRLPQKGQRSMASILEEFAYGNITPEAQGFKRDSRFGRAMELVSRNEQKLLERLGADDRELFQKYIDAQGDVNQLTAVDNLIYGYKLGLIMTAEAFVGMDSLIAGEESV